jgi:hypothetical protein
MCPVKEVAAVCIGSAAFTVIHVGHDQDVGAATFAADHASHCYTKVVSDGVVAATRCVATVDRT